MSIAGIRKHYMDHDKVYWELCDAYKKILDDERNKKDLVFRRLKKEAIIHFDFILRLEVNKQHKTEIKEFGKKLKNEVPEVYEALSRERRNLQILFNTNYLAYPFISGKVKKKYND